MPRGHLNTQGSPPFKTIRLPSLTPKTFQLGFLLPVKSFDFTGQLGTDWRDLEAVWSTPHPSPLALGACRAHMVALRPSILDCSLWGQEVTGSSWVLGGTNLAAGLVWDSLARSSQALRQT